MSEKAKQSKSDLVRMLAEYDRKSDKHKGIYQDLADE